jgi:hypothetical protein
MARDHGPQIKDDEQYEALRERGGKSPPYENWTKDQLEERARELGIAGRSRMRKDELIDAIRHH